MVQVRVKKPAAVLFDFSGTTVRESFVEKYLMPYFKVAYKAYFEMNWDKPECQEDIKALTAAAAADSGAPKIDAPDKIAKIEQLAKYADYCEMSGKSNKAFVMYRFHVWFDGYERGKITTPVYSDVATHITKWKKEQNVKLFIVSNGWAEATKRFMAKTSHGDLAALIDEQFDTTLGPLTESDTYKKILAKIKEKPENVVFLTKSPEEAKSAIGAGLSAIMVITHSAAVDSAKENSKGAKGMDIPIARSFTQIDFF